MRGWFTAVNGTVLNSCANSMNFNAKGMNLMTNGMDSTAKVLKSMRRIHLQNPVGLQVEYNQEL